MCKSDINDNIKLTPEEKQAKIKNIIRMLQQIEELDREETGSKATTPLDSASSVAFSRAKTQHILLVE